MSESSKPWTKYMDGVGAEIIDTPVLLTEDTTNNIPVVPTIKNALRECQAVADVGDILDIYQQPPGLFICVKSQLPNDAKVIRSDVNVLSNELHAVLGTTDQTLFWRNQPSTEPSAIPFFPKKSIQNVQEVSDSALRQLMDDPVVGQKIIDFCNRVIVLFQAEYVDPCCGGHGDTCCVESSENAPTNTQG